MAKRGTVNKKQLKDHDDRPIRWRKYPHLFLICCEDQKTERYYFESLAALFPEHTVYLRTVGTGKSTIGVVEQCIIERYKLAEEANKTVDESWAVFDKDDADRVPANAKRFNDAFIKAEAENISVAYSNEVFELWLLLHFEDVDSTTPIARANVYERLGEAIKAFPSHNTFTYVHGNTSILTAVSEIGSEDVAITQAERILLEHNTRRTRPIDANPSTTVHILVRRLRELIEWYSYEP